MRAAIARRVFSLAISEMCILGVAAKHKNIWGKLHAVVLAVGPVNGDGAARSLPGRLVYVISSDIFYDHSAQRLCHYTTFTETGPLLAGMFCAQCSQGNKNSLVSWNFSDTRVSVYCQFLYQHFQFPRVVARK